MPNLLAITHHNDCEYLSNPLLHETVITGTIQMNKANKPKTHGPSEGNFRPKPSPLPFHCELNCLTTIQWLIVPPQRVFNNEYEKSTNV